MIKWCNLLIDVTPLHEGRIPQALSEAIEMLLKEYMEFICQLELQHKNVMS